MPVFERQFAKLLFLWAPDVGAMVDAKDDDAAFEARSREFFDYHARVFAITAGLFGFVFWPSDLVTLRRLPEAVPAFIEWRLAATSFRARHAPLPRRARI